MKIAIYARVSTEDQNLENQLEQLKGYCDRMDYEIYDIYKDKISGSKESRPGFNKLMQDSRKKRFDAVLCWKLDRLGRSLEHLISIIKEWKKRGIDLICYQQNIDTTNASGKLMFQIIGAFAEFERNMIRERTKAGLERARKQGKKLGRPSTSEYHKKKILDLYDKLGSIKKVSEQVNKSYGTVYKIIKKREGKK